MKSSNFISRSLMSALLFLKDSVFTQEYASKNGFLQGVDPRFKTASFAILFIAIVFLKRVEFLILLYFICLALAFFSKVSPGYFLKRTWVFMPFFSLLIAIPAIFNIFSPGQAIAVLRLANFQLFITKEGLQAAALFVMRVLVGVSYAVLLSLVTSHTELLKVLRIFKIPQIFIMTLGMCYRYIYLFVEIIESTYLSIRSRTGGIAQYKKGQKIVAWNIAYLWQRSYVLSQEVYMAMLSRGYKGEPVLLYDLRSGIKDWAWLFLVAAIFLSVIYASIKLI